MVDLALRARDGVASYAFKAAANFDASFTSFATVPSQGLRSPTCPEQGNVGSQFRGLTRFLFDPADYTATNAAVTDLKPFWVRIAQTTFAGVTSADEARHLVLPYRAEPNRPVIVTGQAPAGNNVGESMELQLPSQCNDLFLQVDGSVDLYLAFEPGGPEFKVSALQNNFTPLTKFIPSFSQLFIRGNAAVTTFSAMMALKDSPL